MKIYNLIILDESGSMSSIRKQAIDGFNETIQTIKSTTKKHPEQQHAVSLVTFNGAGIKTVYDRVDADSVKELNDKLYVPDSLTPLYDAMGKSLTELKKSVEADDKVLVTIITDGEENNSREYRQPAIKALVDELKAKGWVFTYMGANQDVEKVATSISVTNVMNWQATSEGTTAMFQRESKSRKRWYNAIANKIDESLKDRFFDEDEDEDEGKK
ncbi:MAG: VWA domain-containing protein [Tannerella sp.]|jgi:uncharacterized protein YegL|nr:VWA domain-containing protein [Tannerella sp.]